MGAEGTYARERFERGTSPRELNLPLPERRGEGGGAKLPWERFPNGSVATGGGGQEGVRP